MKSPLGIAIFAMAAILVVGFLVIAVTALNKGDSGGLDSYARGEMHRFTQIDDAPAQPVVAYSDADGGEVRLSDYRGQVILVNFWATWCGPCVEEMPALDRLQGELGGEDFQVVTVSLDRGWRSISESAGELDEATRAEVDRWLTRRGLPHRRLSRRS